MEVEGFPPGFVFLPSPQQCISYLESMVTSQPLPFASIFLDLDPYNLKQLPEIFSSAEKKGEVYTFTKLHKKGKIGNINVNRRVGNATWHGDRTVVIPNENDGTPIGMYQKFSYREKGSQYNHQFLMTEYTLPKGTSLQYDPLKDYVLCHVVMKGWKHNGKKVSKSKSRTTNHQVAAVFRQPEPNVAIATPSFSGMENPSTSYSSHSSNADTPTYVQPLDQYTPFPAPLGGGGDLFDILMYGTAIATPSFSGIGKPSTSSSSHSSNVDTPTYVQPLDQYNPFPAPLGDGDDLFDILMDFGTDSPSLESRRGKNMKKRKQMKKKHASQKSTSTRRLEYIKRDDLRLTVPIGPRFQAELPDWPHSVPKPLEANGGATPLILEVHNGNVSESDSSKWLGTKVWPTESKTTDHFDMNIVGKGRPEICSCTTPGSVECIERHVAAKRVQLQVDLGPAFGQWKFDEMGKDVSKLWTREEEKKFEIFVKRNPISEGKSFMEPAIKCFPLRCRKTIASYYFNVYVPKRIGYRTRLGFIADTDDEEGECPNLKGSRKRLRADDGTKLVKARYLTGRR